MLKDQRKRGLREEALGNVMEEEGESRREREAKSMVFGVWSPLWAMTVIGVRRSRSVCISFILVVK
jgi:hypothetical protein